MEWKFTLGIPGPVTQVSIGNFPVTIFFLTTTSFFLLSGSITANVGDTIILTGSPINGTYTVAAGTTPTTIYTTTAFPFFSGSQPAFIEVIRPAATIEYTEIEEPVGFNEITFMVGRDELWHGIFFEASTSQLGFYGEAFTILKEQKESYGVDAVVVFTASGRCDGEDDFEEAISGKLNFAKYQETCGNQCLIRMAVERDNCAMTFKNRFDQKVDVDSTVAFDKLTNLVQYDGLRFGMELATQEIPISADAQVAVSGDPLHLDAIDLNYTNQNLLVRPIYATVTDNSILTGQLDNPTNVFQDPNDTFLLSPQVLLEENQSCISEDFEYTIQLKGSILMTNPITVGTNYITVWAIVDYWDGVGSHTGPGNLTGNATELHRVLVVNGQLPNVTYNFDQTFTGTTPLPVGSGLYAYIKVYNAVGIFGDSAIVDFDINWDTDTSFLLTNVKACPPTDADVYLINETLARVTESITDHCLTIQSDYYGRTDSEPYSSLVDGCGGLRILTPGLRIRQATDKNFFASMKELMEGLRAIDNIGMGMETDRIRIEPAEYFYQDVKIMDMLLIPDGRSEIDDTKVYSNIKYGYEKWEIKSIKGIDEFNSAKQARTGIKSVNNELDITSNLIASGYIIENLRTQTLVNTGNTDSTYDNDIFIITVARDAYGYSYIVEQGITENAANFFSPATAYNWRIRPISNLMRWFKSIAQSYTNLINTASKIFFTSGTGNYLAEGNINAADPCVMENHVMAENDDIAATDFMRAVDATPIYKPETITFEYPLSIAEYQAIKSAPYGYINVQCGQGDTEKAFIKTISYKPAERKAEMTLIKKWV